LIEGFGAAFILIGGAAIIALIVCADGELQAIIICGAQYPRSARR